MSRGVGQHHGALRSSLIDAALELVAESDAEKVTLRAVARRAGVSTAAPYHHFPDKDALLAAVACEGFESLGTVQLAVLGGPGSASDLLEELVRQYVLFALRHRTHYRLMFRTVPTEVSGDEGVALRKAASTAFSRLSNAVREVNPELTADEAGRRALLGWALAHGAVDVGSWAAALRPDHDAEGLAADVGRAVRQMAVQPD
ncbi:hypothetical protein ASG82_02620 [Mycobacterium sp. Soil538]|nr:hypothetical protein ASG82_02620 [Mycobacterium sp. Soil538]